uniref:Odorant binding protein 7 n=1 Tax=Agrotis ipsilon TaxID=56364 RepID=U5KEQ5_AGRIP|nr:odorant binding protein 7 [Agrotis ipsilon]
MSKFTCVLCVVALSLSSVYVTRAHKPNLRDAWRSELDECAKEYPVTNDEIDTAVRSGDSSNLNPCFNFCVFNKTGFFTENGEYDLKNGLIKLRKAIRDDEEYTKFEEVATECTEDKNTSCDEKAKCDSANRLSLCFLRFKDKVRI